MLTIYKNPGLVQNAQLYNLKIHLQHFWLSSPCIILQQRTYAYNTIVAFNAI